MKTKENIELKQALQKAFADEERKLIIERLKSVKKNKLNAA